MTLERFKRPIDHGVEKLEPNINIPDLIGVSNAPTTDFIPNAAALAAENLLLAVVRTLYNVCVIPRKKGTIKTLLFKRLYLTVNLLRHASARQIGVSKRHVKQLLHISFHFYAFLFLARNARRLFLTPSGIAPFILSISNSLVER